MAENTVQDNQTQVQVQGGQPAVPTTREENRYIIPPVDIFETENELTVIVDMPGVDKEDVDIRIDNNLLTIQGTVKRQTQGQGLYNEYALLDYFRQFQLSDRIDQGKINAHMKNGVLTIELPKAERAKPKQIEVKLD